MHWNGALDMKGRLVMDNTVKGSLILDKNQPDGTLFFPGCKLILEYHQCEGAKPNEEDPRNPRHNYNLEKIDKLLMEGFSYEDLLRFCSYKSEFMELREQLHDNRDEKPTIVRRIIEFAERKMLIDILLEWIQEKNPRLYDGFFPSLRDVSSIGKKIPTDECAA